MVAGAAAVLTLGVVVVAIRAEVAPDNAHAAQTLVGQTGDDPTSAAADISSITGPKRRPNVVMIMADDMRGDDLRFMPSLRRLVTRQGLTFSNSFSPYPLCCPARASFMSGQYAHNHHVYSHADPYGFASFDDRETIATSLRRAGYRTGFIGKYFNGYGKQDVRGTAESSVKYVPPGWTEWQGSLDTTRLPRSHPRAGSTYDYFDMTLNVNGRLRPHQGEYSTKLIGAKARQLITKYSRQRAPFFLWVSALAPHHGGPAESDDVRFRTPARPNWVKGRFDDQIRRAVGLSRRGLSEVNVRDKPFNIRSRSPISASEREAMLEASRQRAESIFVLDLQVRRIVERLRRTGEYSNTVIIFTSDNGYFAGEHRMRRGKTLPYEPALRVPLVMAGGPVPRGTRNDPITTLDLTATITDYANATMPHLADGSSMVGTIRHGDRGWRRPIVTEALVRFTKITDPRTAVGRSPVIKRGRDPLLEDPRGSIGIRTLDYKYVRYTNGESELYHLTRDPNELVNVVDHVRYGDVARAMRRVWRHRKDCRGVECRQALPTRLQVGPRLLAKRTRIQEELVRQRLGH